MAAITAASVKALREKTGLPMMDCKKALQESDGNVDDAIELLRKAGKKTMEKRAGRSTSSGRIANLLRSFRSGRNDYRAAMRIGPGCHKRKIRRVGEQLGKTVGYRPRC